MFFFHSHMHTAHYTLPTAHSRQHNLVYTSLSLSCACNCDCHPLTVVTFPYRPVMAAREGEIRLLWLNSSIYSTGTMSHQPLHTEYCPKYTMHTAHCTLKGAPYTMHIDHYTMQTARYIMHNIHCTIYTAHCPIYIAYWPLTMHTDH